MQRGIVLIILIGLAFIAGCAEDYVKPPSPESELVLDAFKFIEEFRLAYLKKDMDKLAELSTPGGFEALKAGMKDFKEAELTFKTRLVEIDNKDNPVLRIAWEGKWKLADGKAFERKGTAAIKLSGRPLKFDGALLENPFAMPE